MHAALGPKVRNDLGKLCAYLQPPVVSSLLPIDNLTPAQGETLSASNTLADVDGLSGPISYQWQRDGSDIAGATGSTYTTTQTDVGSTLSVVARYTDDAGEAEAVASGPTVSVTNVNDLGVVSIDDTTPEQNQLLSASVNDVEGIASAMGPRPVTIRTLDLGGDKAIPNLDFAAEENPQLGWRSIRLSLDTIDHFRAQLRAILRASASRTVRLLFPMISGIGELREAQRAVAEVERQLTETGTAFDPELQVGVMIDRANDRFVDFESEFRGKTHGAQHAYRVLAHPNFRVADQHNPFLADVFETARVIPDAEVRDVVVKRITGEVPAPDILVDRPVNVVTQDPPGVIVLDVAVFLSAFRGRAKRRDFNDLFTETDVREPESASDQAAIAEQRPNLFRMGVRGDIEILRVQAEQRISHAASDQERLIA